MVAQPVRAMGETALDLLAQRIAGTRLGSGTTTVMEPRLMVRKSCVAPASAPNAEAADV
jgi:LacI family transcriptional regulator